MNIFNPHLATTIVFSVVATLATSISCLAQAQRKDGASVTKIRDCNNVADCAPQVQNPKGRIEVDGNHVKFIDADGKLLRERILSGARGEDTYHEVAYPLDDDVAVVCSRWKSLDDGMEDISHDILDRQGKLLMSIKGPETPEVIRPAPNLQLLVGWHSYMGSEGEPFSFYDSSGRFVVKSDGIFCPSGTADCGAGIEVAFSEDGQFVVFSVRHEGLAVFSRDGVLRWKKAIPGWSGRHLHFLPSGERFVVVGEATHLESAERVKSGKLKWKDIERISPEERAKLLLPTPKRHGGLSLYCFSVNNETPLWTEIGWGGTISVHESQDLLVCGSAEGQTDFRVGLFDKNGPIRAWKVPRTHATPALAWAGDYPILLFEEVNYPAKGVKTVRVRKLNGVRAAYIFDQNKSSPLWSKVGDPIGFEFENVGHGRFITSDNSTKTLFELK